MSFDWKTAALGALAALSLGGAAQATDLSITIRTEDHGAHRHVADYDDDIAVERRFDWRGEDRYGAPDLSRHDLPRALEWHPDRPYRGGFHGVPVAERPYRHPYAANRAGWRDCRVTIREKVNRFGELIEVRKTVCP